MRYSRAQLERAFNEAKRKNATLENPIRFTADHPIDCGGMAPHYYHTRHIPEGSVVRVHYGRDHGYIIWTTPDGANHITYED